MEESKPEQESKKISPLITVVLPIVIAISIILFAEQEPEEPEGPYRYVGVWKHDNSIIEIAAKPGKEVDETVQFPKMNCTLLLPIRIRSISGRSQEMYVKEGIYNCGEGKDVIIAFCNHCGHNILMGVRRNEKELQFGCSRKAYCFNLVNYVLLQGHNTYVKFEHYQWVTYEPVKP